MVPTNSKTTATYKILVIGDPGVGKTSLIRRFVHKVFTANYKVTMGVDFALKIIQIDKNTEINLQIWDISGQDRYGVMTRVYYKDAHAAVVVFDSTREKTWDGAMKWKTDLDSKVTLADGSAVPAILLANKCDISSNLTDEKLTELARENGFVSHSRTSAKDSTGVDEAFQELVKLITSTQECGQYEIPFSGREGNLKLTDATTRHESDSRCC